MTVYVNALDNWRLRLTVRRVRLTPDNDICRVDNVVLEMPICREQNFSHGQHLEENHRTHTPPLSYILYCTMIYLIWLTNEVHECVILIKINTNRYYMTLTQAKHQNRLWFCAGVVFRLCQNHYVLYANYYYIGVWYRNKLHRPINTFFLVVWLLLVVFFFFCYSRVSFRNNRQRRKFRLSGLLTTVRD